MREMADPNGDPNGLARWKERQAALAWERPAKAAMTLAVLASLGAIAAWALLLVDGGDPRFSASFWAIALAAFCWMGPVQFYARWTMRTLWLALLLWPALALAALVALLRAGPGAFSSHADAALLTATLAGTVALSVAGLACLRASSLPGGTATAEFRPAGYKPASALPAVDPLLLDAQRLLLMPLIPVILLGSGAAAALTIASPGALDDGGFAIGMGVFAAFLAAFVALLVWGQRQARRWPSRTPTGLLGLAGLLGTVAIGLTAAVFAASARAGLPNMALAGVVMAVLAAGVLAAEFVAGRRLLARARGTRGGA